MPPQRSPVWNHFIRLHKKPNSQYYLVLCKYCNRFNNGNTSTRPMEGRTRTMEKHLTICSHFKQSNIASTTSLEGSQNIDTISTNVSSITNQIESEHIVLDNTIHSMRPKRKLNAVREVKTTILTYQNQLTQEIEELIRNMPNEIHRIQNIIKDRFQERRPTFVQVAIGNNKQISVKEVLGIVRDEIEGIITTLRKLSEWIQLLAPPVTEGSNFGVEVLKYVAGKINDGLLNWKKVWDSLPEYHQQRAIASANIIDISTNTSTNSPNSNDILNSNADNWREYLLALDVKWYFNLASNLEEICQQIIMTIDLIEKNRDKILRPNDEQRRFIAY